MAKFDESKHPRDEDGKFTDGSKTHYRQNASYEEILAADKRASVANVPTAVKFNRLNTKNHIRHAKELGYKNQTEYEKAAIDFFNSKRGKLYYSSVRSRYYKYDTATGEFVVSSDGFIHTYYKVTQKKFAKIKSQDELYEI